MVENNKVGELWKFGCTKRLAISVPGMPISWRS